LETAAFLFDHLLLGEPDWAGVLALQAAADAPRLRAVLALARQRGVPHLWDEDGLTLGLGVHARTWPLDALPADEEVVKERVPFCFVTGTNGKTTSTRLVAHIARVAGFVPGHTSSDGVVIGESAVQRGDWTGPGAARRVLRDPRVTFAVLETARGGLMRRGLAVMGADAALVTNVSEDHLGEWGICDLAATAEMKLVVARGLRPGGVLVVHGACAPLAEAARALAPVWFSVDPAACPAPPRAYVADGQIVLDGEPLLPVADVPITLGGAARFNVENVLGAALLARVMGLPRAAIAEGLRTFLPTPEHNAGRMNVLTWRGAHAVVDFAHNPDGVRQLEPVVRALGAGGRRLVLLGQAGDRRDEDMAALVDAVVQIGFDRIQLKELPDHLRGRAPGEIPATLRAALEARGVAPSAIADAPDGGELAAVEAALAWSRPGDLLLLLAHEHPAEVVARLRQG
jgi:cyanophycin synthetase